MSRAFFLAGTDTDVGKTLVACTLLQAAASQRYSVLGLKPVASGCKQTDLGLRNSDALLLQRYSSIKLPYEQVNPYAFLPAIAPHIAARQAGINIELASLKRQVTAARSLDADILLIEGAGGWRTPLSDTDTLADLAISLQLPVILVVGMQLGCINHALLTAEAIRSDGLQLAGWVANFCNAHMQQAAANLTYLQQHLGAPCLAQIPYSQDVRPEKLASSCHGWPARTLPKEQT